MKSDEDLDPYFLAFYWNIDTGTAKQKFSLSGQALDQALLLLRMDYRKYLMKEKQFDIVQAMRMAQTVIQAYQDSKGEFEQYMTLCKKYYLQDNS